MKWFFPGNNGGQEYGFHEAGVETFKGNINRSLARETLQNCIDARNDKSEPVRVRFEKFDLSCKSTNWLTELRNRFQACGKYWSQDANCQKFFKHSVRLINKGIIPVLKISDFNTTGVRGKDDERNSGWHSLVKSSGSSSKFGGEGGSFGIGKNAPFAASALRTVLYSTRTDERNYAFQGVARLVTHEFKKTTAQNVGYLGADSGAALRKSVEIPNNFRRTENGTDIFVLGYETGQTWQEDLKFSVLENFWAAVMKERLVVEIDGEIIDAYSLPEMMEEFSVKNDFNAHYYYKAATVKERTVFAEPLKYLGDVYLSLIDGDSSFPKKIAMVRSTGMVIYEKHFRSIVPYAGFFFCDSEDGNKKLSSMEPPRHDDWDKDRPEPRANKKTLDELYGWLKQKVRSIKFVEESHVTDIPDLYKWLPDDAESEFSNAEANLDNDKTENPEQPPKEEILFVQVKTKEEKDKPKPSPEPRPDSTRIPVESRIFLVEPETNTYRAVLKPEVKADSASVRISAVGDDAKPVPVRVVKAWSGDGQTFAINEKGVIQNLSLSDEQNTKIYVQIDSADRLSLEASAHET